MCTTCGCSDQANPRLTTLDADGRSTTKSLQTEPNSQPNNPTVTSQEHEHPHSHVHTHPDHHHGEMEKVDSGHLVTLEARVLEKNDRLAERNRAWLAGRGVFAMNIMSSPGAGKTTLLERTLADLSKEIPVAVIEGDQETLFDADRICKIHIPVVQVNTGQGCHLEADMVAQGLQQLKPKPNSMIFIENVGNLVCPALFDLGEGAKIVVLSVTEGEDKPKKYPHMFHGADLVLINKIDLLPYVDFNLERCLAFLRDIAHHAHILRISAKSGEGLTDWYDWLRERRRHMETNHWDAIYER